MSSLPFGDALAQVVDSLQRLGVPYFVGGSVATVLHGEIRTTHDIDIVVELQPSQLAIEELLERALREAGTSQG